MRKLRHTVLIFVFSFFLATSWSSVQAQGPGRNGPSVASMQTDSAAVPTSSTPAPQIGDQSFQGSVPQGQASINPIDLTLGEAIRRGLKANLGFLTSEQSSREIRAQRLRALSVLLPKVTGQVNAVDQQINLKALGFLFSVPGIPPSSVLTVTNPPSPISTRLYSISALSVTTERQGKIPRRHSYLSKMLATW